NTVTFTAAGTQSATLQTVNGCDSVVTMTLTVNPTYAVTDARTICASELPYTWNSVTFTSAGTQSATLQTVNGCDSVVTMTLTVNQTYAVTDARTICASELPYTWNTVTFTAAGTQSATLQTINGCDSVVTMTLTVNPNYAVSDVRSVCPSELPYTWNGLVFSSAGTQNVTLQTVNGCDSVVTMILTVNQTHVTTDSQTICENELPYTWNGVTFTIAGMNTATLQDANGCDSTVIMTLILNQLATTEFTIETSDSCYIWNDQTYCASGDYVQTLQTVDGCDSVVTLHLTTSVGVMSYEQGTVFLAPNPTKNICRIVGLETEPEAVDLYDMHGKLLMRTRSTEFDVKHLPSGMYMVKVNTGDHIIHLKLIRQ
ncbi:MAG: T9SS type A sorting domain-containing protein, partial [Bacteroidales bacterium]|nr:T9SS type A sorting domain-containing protein [Bacteroidales bacterium]